MAITVTVGPYDETGFIRPGSLSAQMALGGRTTCSFSVRPNVAPSWVPVVGEPVVITRDTVTLYSGYVWSVNSRRLKGIDYTEADVVCVDNGYIADRRFAGERKWANVPSGDIATDIATLDLDSEGVGTTYVTDGPTIETFEVMGYPTAAEALTALAELSQMMWYIDENKELRWFSSSTLGYTAPFNVTADNIVSISKFESLEEYANDIIVKLPQTLLDIAIETFDTYHANYAPDGSRKQFGLLYPVGAAPTVVEIDNSISPSVFTSKTVGIQGVDTGKDWYWSQGSNWITQDGAGTPLPATTALEVTYQGIGASVVGETNLSEMSTRAAIEGGTGKHSRSFDQTKLLTRAQAAESATALLDTFDELPIVIEYETTTFHEPNADLIRPGMRQSVFVSGIDSDSPTQEFIVRSVKFQDKERWPDHIGVIVELVSGPLLQDMPALLKSLSSEGTNTIAGGGSSTNSIQISYA